MLQSAPLAQGDQQALQRGIAAIAAMLESDPSQALEEAQRLLREAPGHPVPQLLEAQALRRTGQTAAAIARLDTLVAREPRMVGAAWELAQLASEAGDSRKAVAALESLTRQQPAIATGWFLMARELRRLGREQDAWRAELSGVHASSRDPELLQAAMAMNAGRFDEAAARLKTRSERIPEDPAAIRLLGEIAWRQGDISVALDRVETALAMAPGFDLARDFLVRLLLQANRLKEAMEHVDVLASSPVANPGHDLLRASVLVRMGDHEQAKAIYERLLTLKPDHPQVWQNLGHVLKTMGHQDDAIEAYRKAVTHRPAMGEAWWSLANLKTVHLGADDVAAMEAALATLDPQQEEQKEDLFHLHFALGKALEDAERFEASFRHYHAGNSLRRTMVLHDAADFSAEVAATARAFNRTFLAGLESGGCPAPDPIFIVGLPRSGSTLVEQILASHSAIEGTMELPEMMMIAGRLQSRIDNGEFADFAAMAASLSIEDRARLGEEYIERTRVHRQTDRPLFIDKMPNNWQHVGLIRMILPKARIIDARRHPLSCCLSGWKQHFARGQAFSYDLGEIGRYYRDYVASMAAYDAADPGAVHRVIYEHMVHDTEAEIRRLLAYLGLPFEQSCLEFHRNTRAVRTASSEQVRQPIYTQGIGQWKNYEAWLGPLAQALGSVAKTYPDVPPDLA